MSNRLVNQTVPKIKKLEVLLKLLEEKIKTEEHKNKVYTKELEAMEGGKK